MAKFRVTYATLSADNEDLHAAYEQGVATARSWLGQTFPTYVNGEARDDGAVFELVSPNDHSLKLASFHAATERDIQDAVTSARAAAPAWAETPWRERVAVLRRAADLISYYCDQVQANDGFDHKMSQLFEYEHTRSVLRPYGVWAVISPFNFPMALAAGPSGAALVAGNTVLFKPSPQGSFTGVKLYECLRDAGVPAGAFHFLPGGDEVGAAIVRNPGVDGITFTGSYVLGVLARLRRAAGAGGVPGQAGRARPRGGDRRPGAAARLHGAGDRPGRGRPLPPGRRGGQQGGPRAGGRRAAGRQPRPAGRQLRGGDGGRRPARRPSPLQGRAVRAVRGHRWSRLPRAGFPARQRHRVRADGGLLFGRRGRGPAVPRHRAGGGGVRQPPGR